MRNPKLKAFEVLIGDWTTVGTHPGLPGIILHGRSSFEWIEGGAFLLMQTEVAEEGIPSGKAIFSSDDASDIIFMNYFDERGVSRVYETTLKGNIWQFWRNAPGFSQRNTVTIIDNTTMQLLSELSRDNSTWARDLEQAYTRTS